MSTEQPQQQQQQQSDLKKVGSDCEEFSDTANETGTFEVSKTTHFRVKKERYLCAFPLACGACGIVDNNTICFFA